MNTGRNGFTLLESLIALAIMGIVLAAIVPAFLTYMNVNTLTEQRSGAMVAAQQAIEVLRQQDPTAMPSTGTSAVQLVTVGGRVFEVTTAFCVLPQFCSTDSRHLLVEVSYGGQIAYTVESIFTALQ